MNATAKKGVWTEDLSDEVTLRFDTTLVPERITIQKRGENPVHIECEAGILEKDVFRARAIACEAYHIVAPSL